MRSLAIPHRDMARMAFHLHKFSRPPAQASNANYQHVAFDLVDARPAFSIPCQLVEVLWLMGIVDLELERHCFAVRFREEAPIALEGVCYLLRRIKIG